jgi:hypothetical protein
MKLTKSEARTQSPPRDSLGISYKGRVLNGDKSLPFPESGAEVQKVLFAPPVRRVPPDAPMSDGEKYLLEDAPWRRRVYGYNLTRPPEPK